MKDLLERGDPNLRAKQPWTPHRPARPEKSEGGIAFRSVSEYEPKGDQPQAIQELVAGIKALERDQVLLGVTGSRQDLHHGSGDRGDTAPGLWCWRRNKTLAAQALWRVQKLFFPTMRSNISFPITITTEPEAYVPRSDTYIEKESSINEQIDRMRHSGDPGRCSNATM